MTGEGDTPFVLTAETDGIAWRARIWAHGGQKVADVAAVTRKEAIDRAMAVLDRSDSP